MCGILRNSLLVLSFMALGTISVIAADTDTSHFKTVKKLPLEGGGRWDYLFVDGDLRRLYMSRATHFSVIDADSGVVSTGAGLRDRLHSMVAKQSLGFRSENVESTNKN
jgi:hypothetical protein